MSIIAYQIAAKSVTDMPDFKNMSLTSPAVIKLK